MNMIQVKRFLAKLRLTKVSDVLEKLKLLQQWEMLDANQTRALQQERLTHVLLHAYRHVPYYRDILRKSGAIDYSGKVNLNHFACIPPLGKDTIRAKFEAMKSDDLHTRKCYSNSSGGSTGKPVTFIQHTSWNHWAQAVAMLFDSWTSYSLSDPKVLLWGSLKDIFRGAEGYKTQVVRWLKNETWLNAFRMTPEQMKTYIKK